MQADARQCNLDDDYTDDRNGSRSQATMAGNNMADVVALCGFFTITAAATKLSYKHVSGLSVRPAFCT